MSSIAGIPTLYNRTLTAVKKKFLSSRSGLLGVLAMAAGFARSSAAGGCFRPYRRAFYREIGNRNFSFEGGTTAVFAFDFLLFGGYPGENLGVFTTLAAIVLENRHISI